MLHLQRAGGELERCFADQDLAGRGRGGEIHRTPDGVAREAGRLGTADERFTCCHAAAHGQAQATVLLQGGCGGGERAAAREGRLGGAQGVILVQGGYAEDAEDALAGHGGELAPVALQGRLQDREGVPDHDAERLRVQPRSRTRGYSQLHAEYRDRLAHRCRCWCRDLGRRLRCPERGILAQDRGFELAQGRRRFEPQLLGKQVAEVTVDRERIGLAVAAVQREHELPVETLPQGLLRGQALQFADQLASGAEGQIGFDALLDTVKAQLFEPCDFCLGEGIEPEIGQCRPAPEREGPPQHPCRVRGGTAGERLTPAGEQLLEALHVDLVRSGPEQVAHRPGDETALRKRSAQTRDGRLQRIHRRWRSVLPPQLHKQPLGRHDLVGVQHEQGEDGPLAHPSHGNRQPILCEFERTQEANLHGPPPPQLSAGCQRLRALSRSATGGTSAPAALKGATGPDGCAPQHLRAVDPGGPPGPGQTAGRRPAGRRQTQRETTMSKLARVLAVGALLTAMSLGEHRPRPGQRCPVATGGHHPVRSIPAPAPGHA